MRFTLVNVSIETDERAFSTVWLACRHSRETGTLLVMEVDER